MLTGDYPSVSAVARLLDAELPGWIAWEPETLRQELRRRKRDVSAPTWSVIQAIRLLRQNRVAVETDLAAFSACMHGLNGHEPSFERLAPCTAAELTFGWLAMQALVGTPKTSPETVAYVRACMAEDGLYAYPDPLRQFEPERDQELCVKIRARCNPDEDGPAGDDVVSVQAAKLGDVYRYCAARQREANREAAAPA